MTARRHRTHAPEETEGIVGVRPTPAQARGQEAEDLAAQHLERNGLRIIARNVRCRGGEVDLICIELNSVIFVEVRLRTNTRFGGAAESITPTKQRRVLHAARWWLNGAGRRFQAAACRFDAILLDRLDAAHIIWLRGAFDAG
ncbi:MAG TPA: YraN family protein [Thauera sp.]|nr:YraN family protein [Thauera sp.]